MRSKVPQALIHHSEQTYLDMCLKIMPSGEEVLAAELNQMDASKVEEWVRKMVDALSGIVLQVC